MSGTVADTGEAIIERHVQPLMAIGGLTISELDPSQVAALGAAGACHQSEGSVDVHPGASSLSEWDQGGEGVARANI